MPHIFAAILTLLFVFANFQLWALKQEPPILFGESLGIGAAAFGTLYWYVTRPSR